MWFLKRCPTSFTYIEKVFLVLLSINSEIVIFSNGNICIIVQYLKGVPQEWIRKAQLSVKYKMEVKHIVLKTTLNDSQHLKEILTCYMTSLLILTLILKMYKDLLVLLVVNNKLLNL